MTDEPHLTSPPSFIITREAKHNRLEFNVCTYEIIDLEPDFLGHEFLSRTGITRGGVRRY